VDREGETKSWRPFKQGHETWNKGKQFTAMLGNKYGALLKGVPKSDEWKSKASLAKMGDKNPMKNSLHAKKMADSKRGKPNPKLKEYWSLHKEEQLRKMMVGEHRRPNKLELRLFDLIQRNELQFQYVGNWELLLGGKCPDFVSTNGKKQLIELFGDYWHSVKARETAEQRTAHFKRFGYETLIIWEHDLQKTKEQL
jgi:G:T-mismatch repair DNA endonuclease (very short patch repair protein)